MPYWNCERCGARLYSASKTLKRQSCPQCDGQLTPLGDTPSRFGRDASTGARPASLRVPGPVDDPR
jgi:hypothetical protein